MIIYKITNKINNKVYIGQTKQPLNVRYRQHVRRANNGTNTRLYNAMRKHGILNFDVSVVEEIDDNIDDATTVLNERERYWIEHYDACGVGGYNSTAGGDTNPMDNKYSKSKHDIKMRSTEVRNAISQSLKNYRQQHPFTAEHKKKLSEKAKGNHNFGSGDTRSVGVYCVDKDGVRREFHSIKDATVWWFNAYHPFGDKYVLITLQRKIKASMEKRAKFDVEWHKIEKDPCEETIESIH